MIETSTAIQAILNRKFQEISSRNSSFSLRAFARRLDVSPSTLSRILGGERGVSARMAEQLCTRLALDPQERAEVLAPRVRRSSNAERNYLQISADQFKTIAEWHHFAILSLFRTSDFQSDAAWIAKRLGISETETLAALERLERLGMINRPAQGAWTRSEKRFRTTDDVLSVSLQKAHRTNLEMAADAIHGVPIELRDLSSVTVPMNPAMLPKAKAMIRKFQDDLATLVEAEPGTEVYKACVQLFPLTRVSGANAPETAKAELSKENAHA